MNSLVIVGMGWGDEGKGKITDYLCKNFDVCVRFQGGNNAGHTIKFNNNKYALNLIPSGIFNNKIENIMSNGMVINPESLVTEINFLKSQDFNCENLHISDRAHVLFPYHIKLDEIFETLKGNNKVGTTKKGIGPCYMDKSMRIGIRIGDLMDELSFYEKLSSNLKYINKILLAFNSIQFSIDEIFSKYISYANTIRPYVKDTSLFLSSCFGDNKKILFEGAQGIMLCLDHGTYPYVTSSSPSASSVAINCGIPPQSINKVLGISKSYSTRVGEGVFPTEMNSDTSNKIREIAHEYGTTTGRPRRIGWLDAVILKHGKRISGVTNLAITLLDVLTGIDKIKICTSYLLNGKEIDYIPSTIDEFSKCKPIYIELNGWDSNISNVKSFDDLPTNAKNYIFKIEEITGIKVSIISVGADREQTIEINKNYLP